MKKPFALMLLVALSMTALMARGQSASERSYKRARQVLDSGIEALGGLDALRGIKDITLREKGKHRYIHQSPNVEPPFLISSREETTVVDFARGRLLIDTLISNPSYYVSNSATIINGSEGYTLDKWSKEVAPISNPSLSNFRNHFYQRFPHYVLLEALNSELLALGGRRLPRGKETGCHNLRDCRRKANFAQLRCARKFID